MQFRDRLDDQRNADLRRPASITRKVSLHSKTIHVVFGFRVQAEFSGTLRWLCGIAEERITPMGSVENVQSQSRVLGARRTLQNLQDDPPVRRRVFDTPTLSHDR